MLDEQIACAQSMLAVMDREHQALIDNDPEALNAAGADKVRYVERMDGLERERLALVEALGPAGSAAMQAQWNRLLKVIDDLKARNLRNGSLVRARREQVLAALKLLRGAEPALYDASGSAAAPHGGRILGSA